MNRARRRLLGGVALVGVLLAAAGCTTRSEEWTSSRYEIAGGGTDGVYYAYGTALAQQLSDALGVDIDSAATAGSVDNLLRVSSGEAVLGFAQGDAAADAAAGRGAFADPLPVRTVARLYDEYLHVVVRADSDIASIADLGGRTVSLGARNSGVHVIAERVLDAAAVDPGAIIDPELDLAASITAMERGDIDGFFWVGGIPTPGIAVLAESLPVRLLPIDQGWVTAVNERFSHPYRPSDFPVGLYGMTSTEPTMAVPNYLVTAADTPDEVVHDVLDVLFRERVALGAQVPAAALLDQRQAIFTAPVDLHPGAIEYFREQRH